jgi:hypothetical protein
MMSASGVQTVETFDSSAKISKETSRSLVEMSASEVRSFLLKGSSYCSLDLPAYFNFSPLLNNIDKHMKGQGLSKLEFTQATNLSDVNYVFVHNKDGDYAGRPFELNHPMLFISLINVITTDAKWPEIVEILKNETVSSYIERASLPVESTDGESDVARQINNYWTRFEQPSISLGLDYSYVFHCDVANCYGSLYTHSIEWALHGKPFAKNNRNNLSFLGNMIDKHIRAMRYGQTNGIAQGSVLMDIIAEIVLAFVDKNIAEECAGIDDWKIVRYRDDYRIFVNSPEVAQKIIKALSEQLFECGMHLNPSKVKKFDDPIIGSIKKGKNRPAVYSRPKHFNSKKINADLSVSKKQS